MDMNTIEALVPTADPDDFRPGDAWLAGGTVLFSYGSQTLTRLLDLTSAGWKPVQVTDAGLEFAATCTIAELYALPAEASLIARFPALDLVRPACDSFVASFKIWNLSTMGGNVATSLPAGPIISWLAALDAVASVHGPRGARRSEPVASLIRGAGSNSLEPGELIRSFTVPGHALRARTAFRRLSLTNLGRTGVMVIGRLDTDGQLVLTVSGSTARPHQLRFAAGAHPSPAALLRALEEAIAEADYHDDIHGHPAWRRAMTRRLGVEILHELLPDTAHGR